MIEQLSNAKVAIVGGGSFCKDLLRFLLEEKVLSSTPEILGVADINPLAEGLLYARNNGILTTEDYTELLHIEGLQVLIEITGSHALRDALENELPDGILFIDQVAVRSIWSSLLIQKEKMVALEEMRAIGGDHDQLEDFLNRFTNRIDGIVTKRFQHYQGIERGLIESRRAMSQIIQGSTIPTFVIDENHIVTHWNHACEILTGYKAAEIVGTNHQWKPFRSSERPVMADLILDGVGEADVWKYYGARWKKSGLIDGAYEAEEFFDHLGDHGKWLFFTAAPIKAPGGAVVGAIETLQDKTEERLAKEERESNNRELSKKAAELEASQRIMAQIIQGSTIPTFVIDRNHQITHWNKAMEIITECPAEEMVGTNKQWAPFYESERPSMADVILDQVDQKEIRDLYGNKWRKSAMIEGAFEAEAFFPNLGENGKWCWFTAAPIKSSDGNVVGAIETIWDKTEEKKAEKEQERHTEELATLCSIYATLSSPLDLEGRINAAIREVTNIFSADGICIFIREADGRFHLKYNYGYSDSVCRQSCITEGNSMVSRVAATSRLMILEELPYAGGDELDLLKKEGLQSLVYIPILDKRKNAFGVIRLGSKQAHHFTAEEKHLLDLIGNRIGVAIENSILYTENARKANFQAKLIKSSNNAIVATDNRWKVVLYNPEAERIFGYSAAEVKGKLNARELYPMEVAEGIVGFLPQTAARGGATWHETAIVAKNGEKIPVRFSGTLLIEAKEVVGSVVFFQDLREIKRLERDLVSSERLAAIGQTVAGMAHCIKNILHGFKGGSYLMNVGIDKDNTEKLKQGWQMIQRNIGRTSDLVLDLLSYSKEREPEYEPCLPNDIADDVCDLMADIAAEHEVVLEKNFSPAVGEVSLDARIAHRCLLNLVSNAIDACIFDDDVTKNHRVTVTTAREKEDFIRFEIKDNGCGMSDEVSEKLFHSFFSTKGAKGTGLGLLVTRKLIEEHGGSIDVSSTSGKGTWFTIRLPFVR